MVIRPSKPLRSICRARLAQDLARLNESRKQWLAQSTPSVSLEGEPLAALIWAAEQLIGWNPGQLIGTDVLSRKQALTQVLALFSLFSHRLSNGKLRNGVAVHHRLWRVLLHC